MATAIEIRTAVELLDGDTDLEKVRNCMGDKSITAEQLAEALQPPAPVATADNIAPATVDSGTAPVVNTGSVQDDNRPDGVGPSDDRTTLIMAQVENAKQAKNALLPKLDELQKQKADLDRAIADASTQVAQADQVIEDLTSQISQAEMVKRIQKQTQDRLMAQNEATVKMDAVLKTAGVKTFASPLDQALANGARRSKVMLNGKVHEAPHPRSPEGVRGYANWLHNGPRPTV